MGLKKVLVDCRQLLETDSVGLESDDPVDFSVEVLQLATELAIGSLVFLDEALFLALGEHQ